MLTRSARLALVSPLFFLGAVSPVLAQPRTFPSDSAIRAVLQQRVEAGISPGYAVAVIDSTGASRIITVGTGAGSAHVDAHTLFEIGSITKTFTGTVLASMVADRTVTLTQPVVELLPKGTVIPSRGGRPITLLDLATQSSGLPRMPGNFAPKDPTNPYADYDGTRLLSFLASYALPRDPGAQYEYSNLGVGLLGYALAARANLSYEQLVTRRVLAPLGMRESAIALTPALRARMATGHSADGKPVPLWDLDAIAGAGAIRSSITDMLRYLEANLAADLDVKDRRTNGIGAILADAHRARYDKGPSGMSLGLAWHRLPGPGGDTIVWHNGGTGGFTSFLGFSTKRKMGVVVLTNSTAGPDGLALHWLAGAPLPPLSRPRNSTRAAVTLPSATLDRYVGRFEITPAFALTVARTGTGLTVTATGQSPLEMLAESPTRFFVREVEADFEYEFDTAGNAVSLTLLQGGAKLRGVKK
jgi:CubicO group peptidase (beta-lactamase class C family)